MFKFAAVCCLVLGSAAVSAGEYKFINADGSALGQLCIAAVESSATDTASLKSLAAELGIAAVEVDGVYCNGASLKSFANKFVADQTVTIKTYVVNVADQSPESQLCFAALVSADEFSKLKETRFKNVRVEKEIICNGLPIQQFVRKYRDHVATAAGKPVETASL